jgi:hypothetical protein
MFKWPEPAEGQLYYKQPLIIYFSVSLLLTALVGLFMLYYSDEGVVRAWQTVRDLFTGKNANHRPALPVPVSLQLQQDQASRVQVMQEGLQSGRKSAEGQTSSSQPQRNDGLSRLTNTDEDTSSHTALRGGYLARNIWDRARQRPRPSSRDIEV